MRLDGPRVVGESGTFGNALDPLRAVRRSAWTIGWVDERLEVRTSWPVVELLTPRLGIFVDELAHEVDDAGADGAMVIEAIAGHVAAHRPTTAPGRFARVELPTRASLLAEAYPLLRPALEAGASIDAVPVAIEAMLRCPDARAAAARLGRVTRPLARAVAASLLPDDDGRIAFEGLLVASMAAPTCTAEQLADLLAIRPDPVGAVAFGVADIDRARAMFAGEPGRRVAETLAGYLSVRHGTVDLAEGLAAWAPPVSLGVVPTRVPTTRSRATGSDPADDPGARPIEYPRDWWEARGNTVAGFTVRLPTCANDLMTWGRSMDNCLGSFRMSVAEGRSRILGLADDEGLQYAVECTPAGVVRQFEGRGNRRPQEPFAHEVLVALKEWGLISADRRATRPLGPPTR